MELVVFGTIMFFIGKHSKKMDEFIYKYILKNKKSQYNDFYDCSFKEKDFEEKRGE